MNNRSNNPAARVIGFAVLVVLAAGLLACFVNLRTEATWIEFARNFARTEGNPAVRALYQYRENSGDWPTDMQKELVPKYVDHLEPGIWFAIKDGRPYLSRNCRPGSPDGDVWLTWDFDRKTWRIGDLDLGPLGAFDAKPAAPESNTAQSGR